MTHFCAEGLTLEKNQRPRRPTKCAGCGRYSYADAKCADASCTRDAKKRRNRKRTEKAKVTSCETCPRKENCGRCVGCKYTFIVTVRCLTCCASRSEATREAKTCRRVKSGPQYLDVDIAPPVQRGPGA